MAIVAGSSVLFDTVCIKNVSFLEQFQRGGKLVCDVVGHLHCAWQDLLSTHVSGSVAYHRNPHTALRLIPNKPP